MAINISDLFNEVKAEVQKKEETMASRKNNDTYGELNKIYEGIKSNLSSKAFLKFHLGEPVSGWKNGYICYRTKEYNGDEVSYYLSLKPLYAGEGYSALIEVFTRGPRGKDKGIERKVFDDAKDGIKFIIKKLID